MKEVGKVNKYDGYTGEIINSNGEKYLLKKDEVEKENSPIKEGDNVSFKPEKYKNSEIDINVARFVKVLKK